MDPVSRFSAIDSDCMLVSAPSIDGIVPSKALSFRYICLHVNESTALTWSQAGVAKGVSHDHEKHHSHATPYVSADSALMNEGRAPEILLRDSSRLLLNEDDDGDDDSQCYQCKNKL
jgi:hypothetical protein